MTATNALNYRRPFLIGFVTGLLLIGFSAIRQPLAAQFADGGARVAAMGGAGTALQGEPWLRANTAAPASLTGRRVGFFVSEGFGLSELRLGAVTYVEPTPFGVFSAAARTFGFELFREVHAGIGYARSIRLDNDRRLYLGVQVKYQSVSIDSYGSAAALGISMGWIAHISPEFSIGVNATNLNRPNLAGREELPQTFSLGLAARPVEEATLSLDFFRDIDFPLEVRAGLEYMPISELALRSGVATELSSSASPGSATRFTAGVGLVVGPIHTDVAAERHLLLGWTPSISVAISW